LHVPEEQCSILEQPGRDLRANRQWFAARRAGRAYLGYMRLGYQVIEFLETGALTLPMSEPGRTRILDVQKRTVPFAEVLAEADELQQRLESLVETSPLPDHPHRDAVNRFLADTYPAWWSRRESSTRRR